MSCLTCVSTCCDAILLVLSAAVGLARLRADEQEEARRREVLNSAFGSERY